MNGAQMSCPVKRAWECGQELASVGLEPFQWVVVRDAEDQVWLGKTLALDDFGQTPS